MISIIVLLNFITYFHLVDGNWGQWEDWQPKLGCTEMCGGGNQKRIRRCNDPAAANGGKKCSSDQSYVETVNRVGIQIQQDSKPCNVQDCTSKKPPN